MLQELAQRWPELSLTVQSQLPATLLRDWIALPFEHQPLWTDPGVPMRNAVDIDPEALRKTYLSLDLSWDAHLAEQRRVIEAVRPDLVLTNSSFLVSAAATACGVPAINLCSLNWADLLAHYTRDEPDLQAIAERLAAAYNTAEAFLRFTPGMPMPRLRRVIDVGPVGRVGQRRNLAERLDSSEARRRWVLVSMGGMPFPLDLTIWPRHPDLAYLVPQALFVENRPDVRTVEALGLDWIDLLASVDAVITKPGYGTFVEAAIHRIPLLFLERPDWPEEPGMSTWLAQHVPSRGLSRRQLESGDLSADLEAIWSPAARPDAPNDDRSDTGHPPLRASGARDAADRILEIMTA